MADVAISHFSDSPWSPGSNRLILFNWTNPDNVTGFELDDITVTGDELYGTTFFNYIPGSGWYTNIVSPTDVGGVIRVSVRVDAVDEGNTETHVDFVYGVGLPQSTATFSIPSTSYTSQLVGIIVDFDQDVSNLVLSDFSTSAGTLSNFQQVTASQYTFDLQLPVTGTGIATVTLAEDSVDEENNVTTVNVAYAPQLPILTPVTVSGYNSQEIEIGIEFPVEPSNFGIGDLSTSAGTLSNLTGTGTSRTVRLTLPVTGTGTAVVTLAANSVTPINAAATVSVEYGPVIPTLTPRATEGFNGTIVRIDIVFPVSVEGLFDFDFSSSAGSIDNVQGSGQSWIVDLTLPSGVGIGDVIVTLAAGSVFPNNREATTSVSHRPVTATLTPSSVNVLRSAVVTIAIVFETSITGLLLSHFSATAGTFDELTGSGRNWEVELTLPSTGDGLSVVTLAANSTTPPNAEESAASITYGPTIITLSANPIAALTSQSVAITITAGDTITGLTDSDFIASVGILSNVQGSGENWTATWTMPSSGTGTAILTLVANSVPQGNAQVVVSVGYGPTTLVITPASNTGVVSSIVQLSIVANQSVSGLTNSDFSATNGASVFNVQGSGENWTAKLRMPAADADGSTTITLSSNAVVEGNAEVMIVVNFTTITVVVSFDETSGYWSQEVGVNLNFSSNVTDIMLANLSSDAGVLSNVTGSGRNWEATLRLPNTGTGDATVSIAAGSAAEGNSGGSGSISYVSITATITPSVNEVLSGTNFTFNIVFVIGVNGIAADDFSVDNGTIEGVTGSGRNWEVEVTAPATGSGTIGIVMRVNAAVENSESATGSVVWIAEDPNAPVIDLVAEQNILVDTDYRLRIGITNDPGDAYVVGELEGYSTDWDAGAGEISIIGHPTKLSSGKRYKVMAVSGAFAREREVIYNVIPAVPVIEDFGPFTVYKGAFFKEDIVIHNSPSRVIVRGPWAGLKGVRSVIGAMISGDVPDQDFTIDTEKIKVIASNAAGEVSKEGIINIVEVS